MGFVGPIRFHKPLPEKHKLKVGKLGLVFRVRVRQPWIKEIPKSKDEENILKYV